MEGDNLVLLTLENYKKLAENVDNHAHMLKDKTVLNFCAYVLDSVDEEILKCSLTTLELLARERVNRNLIKQTFGVNEALNTLKTTNENKEICEKVTVILNLLNRNERSYTPLATRKKKVINFHIFGLHLETQKELEDILTKKTKGVINVMVDIEHQRCTLTVFEFVDPKNLAKILSDNTNMEARLVTKNSQNQEVLLSLSDSVEDLSVEDLPPYLDEHDSPVKDKAVRSMKDIRITASEWFNTAAGFIQKSIYW